MIYNYVKEVLKMAQATFSVRMDESLKRQFDALCADFGMNASTAINVFARAVVRERKIPFEISSSKEERALNAVEELREQARKSGASEMTIDEINEEIRLAREERKRK